MLALCILVGCANQRKLKKYKYKVKARPWIEEAGHFSSMKVPGRSQRLYQITNNKMNESNRGDFSDSIGNPAFDHAGFCIDDVKSIGIIFWLDSLEKKN